MNEKEAREFIEDKNSDYDTVYWGECKGYLEAIEKAKVLEEALRAVKADWHNTKICSGDPDWRECACSMNVAEKALAQWEKEK